MDNFICVVIDLDSQKCLGVDFFDSEKKLRQTANIYREDMGPNHLVLEYPPVELDYIKASLNMYGGKNETK